VQVDNSHDIDIPPLSVGYALYGGIYRDVWIIAPNTMHIKVTDHASSGIYIHTPRVDSKFATVQIRGNIVNDSPQTENVRLVNTIVDRDDNIIHRIESTLKIDAWSEKAFVQTSEQIANPHLWSPDDPYLYTVYSEVYQNSVLVDGIKNPLGFRWFEFEPEHGFSLNGKKLQLRGTNRHQDYQGRGQALDNDQHVTDLQWIKEMGANFVRLAHYPQDPVVLETTDRLGLLVWEETPLVNYMSTSEDFLQNSQNMVKEMIRQHYNHPSVIVWGSMNEILLHDKKGKRTPQIDDKTYLKQIHVNAYYLDSLIRAEDPTRYTAMAFHCSDDYHSAGLDTIPQIQAWNVYFGWYGGEVDQFGRWLDRLHKNNPGRNLFISEYGAGCDVRLNGENAQRFDFTGNWQRFYHESYLRQINERPYLAGTAIWNQFDFSQPHTGGSIPHLNQKGMQKWDRKPKDVYYLYKANWNTEPMVHIASHDWTKRVFFDSYNTRDGSKELEKHTIDVYSNLNEIELFCNGQSQGIRQPDAIKKFCWKIHLKSGKNLIVAKGSRSGIEYSDMVVLDLIVIPAKLDLENMERNEIAVNVGYNALFVDDNGTMWLPDRNFDEGSYGYLNGTPTMVNKDCIIIHSGDREPIYNYYLTGVNKYKIDVPDGDYEVQLYFAEPQDYSKNERVFNVKINAHQILNKIDLAGQYGYLKAVSKCFRISVSHGTGINITFGRVIGEPILNAIRVRKI
ncbi:DUF4982 domain-containing protein, partial [candidate division KSB1 bacterium]|nr:DUF4982 domain-containing protein [candidate division KSB1 bacterium]